MSKFILAIGILFSLVSPSLAFAAAPSPQPSDTTNILFGACKGKAASSAACLEDKATTVNPVNHYIKIGADIVAFITGVVAVIMVILSGFSYITSGGNSEKATAARRRLLAGVIGLAIVALAWTLITFLTDSLVKT